MALQGGGESGSKLKVLQGNASLDPVTLQELGEAMASRSWVDMRIVPGGIAQRVMVVALLIKRDEEEVQIEQWIRQGDNEFESRLHWVHAEDIWWIKPTSFSSTDEWEPFSPKSKLQSEDRFYEAACAGVAHYHRITAAEVNAIAKDRLDDNHYRYWVMLVYKELVPKAKPLDITRLFGYQSGQPLVSAGYHAKNDNGDVRLPAMVKHAKGLL